MSKVFCNVTNCFHNESEICGRETIRIAAHDGLAHSTEAVSCMSFQPEEEAKGHLDPSGHRPEAARDVLEEAERRQDQPGPPTVGRPLSG